MKEEYAGKESEQSQEEEEPDNPDKPQLTGNTHIFMERDVSSGRYELLQNGKKLKLQDLHF